MNAGGAMMPFDGGSQNQQSNASGIGDKSNAGFSAKAVLMSDRFRDMDRCQQYYDCTQHDWKRYDFEGRIMRPGSPTSQPLLSGEQASWYVPLRLRRPSSPYRLGRLIVNAFTTLLFGEHRWPSFRVAGDSDTQDFAEALTREASLPVKFTQARNLGGSTGTVGLSWCYSKGKPRVNVHNGKHLYVHEWEDREELIPAHVTEVYRYPKDEWDQVKKKIVRNWYWHRRDWTKDADIVFKDVLFEQNNEPVWTIDQETSNQHDDGETHFVWIQNMPDDEIDGKPDYDGLYDNFDSIDMLYSVLTRGTTLNLDPTLVLKMDLDYVKRLGVKKGSDNALAVGEGGSAEYLEISGTSVTAGISLFESKRRSVLEVAQCILPDPAEISASGMSSVAMKVIYAPMIQKVEQLREQYGAALRRLIGQMVRVAQARKAKPVMVKNDAGEDEEAEQVVNLPPRAETEQELDEQGNHTGKETTTLVERTPGQGTAFELQWGPYFAPTPDDQTKTITMLSLAIGAKPFISKQSASEIAAGAFSRDPAEEWQRLTQADIQDKAAMAAMMGGDMGGAVDDPNALPQGANPNPSGLTPPGPDSPPGDPNAALGPAGPPGAAKPVKPPSEGSVSLTPSDLASIVTVNEARHSAGFGPKTLPDGNPDPDGNLTVAEFKAKNLALVAKNANADKGQAPGVTPPGPPPGAGPGGLGKKPGAPGDKTPPPFGKKPEEE